MSIKKMTHANGTETPDEIIVDYAINDRLGNQIDTTYAKVNDIPGDELFPIHATLSSTTAGISDKSSSEIYTALQAGKTPVVFVGNNMVAFLTYSKASKAIFVYHNWNRTDNTTGSNDVARMEINDQKNVAITWASYAKLASPAFTGTPTAPTATTGTDTTQLATTAFVQQELDTLATVATSGSYNDLIDKPTIPESDVFTVTFTNGDPITCDKTYNEISTAWSNGKEIVGRFVKTNQTQNLILRGLLDVSNTVVFYNAIDLKLYTLSSSGSVSISENPYLAKTASPDFIGTPTAPTATKGTNTTQIASTAFVQTALEDYTPTSSLATVATSGSYSDLTDKPTIPEQNTFVVTITQTSNTAGTSDKTPQEIYNAATSGLAVIADIKRDRISKTALLQDFSTSVSGGIGSANFVSIRGMDLPNNDERYRYTVATDKTVMVSVAYLLKNQSPALIGTPTAPTATTGTNTTQIATTAFVQQELGTLATVASTGSYNDLIDKPVNPTIDYPVTDVKLDGTSTLIGTVATLYSQKYVLTSGTTSSLHGAEYLEDVTYTAPTSSGSDTFLKGINGGSGSMYGTRSTSGSGSSARRTLSISHTHVAASDGSTGSAITGISSGSLTKTTKYLSIKDCSMLYLTVSSETLAQNVYLTQSATNAVTIDWGDESALATSNSLSATFTHTYSTAGNYVVKIYCQEGQYWSPKFDSNQNNYYSLVHIWAASGQQTEISNTTLTKAILNEDFKLNPEEFLQVYNSIFALCVNLKEVSLSETFTFIPANMFQECASLEYIQLPPTVSYLNTASFTESGIRKIILPELIEQIEINTFSFCTNLQEVVMGSRINMIYNDAFDGCSSLTSITIYATTPPDTDDYTFEGIPSDCIIKVPASSVNAYKTATNWSARADYIEAI